MSAMGGKLPFDRYCGGMRGLAGLVICGTALAIGSCKPSPRLIERTASIYGADRCGPVSSAWSKQGQEYGELMARNEVQIGPSSLKWNGVSIDAPTLRKYLQTVDQLNPPINLRFVVDPSTDCNKVKQARALISGYLHCAAGSIPVCVEYSDTEYQAEASRHIVN
jgi:hypothetical protein